MSSDPVFLKHSLIRQIVVEMAVPEKVIEQIISHNFKAVGEALKTNNSVEISGFGKFVARKGNMLKEIADAERMIEKWNKEIEDPEISVKMREKKKMLITYKNEYIDSMNLHLSKL